MADDRKNIENNDISQIKVESTGLSKQKIIGLIIIIFAFLGLILFLHFTLSGNTQKEEKKKVEKEEEIVKENVIDKEAEEKFESELRKSYSEKTKKTYKNEEGNIVIVEEGNNAGDSIDYEKERLAEVKAKISAYKEKMFQEEIASRGSGIGDNSGTGSISPNNDMSMPNFNIGNQGLPLNNNDRMAKYKDNLKVDNVYNKSGLLNPLSEYELKAGGIIPITLYTGINTDIPSNVIAVVREDVYDSTSGRYLLIPKGTKAIGTYDSVLDFGQERVLLLWTRLVFPNGNSISLDKFDGVDLSGYGGTGGRVDSHFGTMLKAVVLSTILSVGDYYVSPSSKDRNRYKTSSPEVIAKEEVVNTFSEIGKDYVDKMLNVQPTIVVKQGTKLNIIINSDLVLEPYEEY
ncbi:TrbI/VirB10 family protein [Fusobacterium gastrosuis]|uniref:TrbI/VirB10 family protein n=1 Tax=Fusobacterium gastrosuis TaxID=1755100 RepID=UPI002970ADBD|nr:TrbI/VirB10 family protein [Fusobacteriaceae bacterium]MDY5714282.1 TrbI/VirB10 family protein [Fusobacterium gastrosuis]